MPTIGTNAMVEVTTQLRQGDPPKDYTVNHLTYNTSATPVSAAQWNALAAAIGAKWFATGGTARHFGACGGKVVVYDRADAKPRPEKGVFTYVPGSWSVAATSPRQVALCLSFYSGRNLPRYRGRIYVPDPDGSHTTERPGAALMTQVLQLGVQIQTATIALTPSWLQTVHSDVLDQDNPVTTFWVNDVWDTVRGRLAKETTRQHNP